MAKRNKNGEALEGVVYLVALMPWWLGVALAVAGGLWLHSVAVSPLPVLSGTGQMSAVVTGSLVRGLAVIGQYLWPVLCLAGAGMSAFKRRQAARLHSDAANRADGMAQMSWREFEVLVAEHFRRLGFSVTETGGGGPDGGVDVLLQKGSDRYVVQCKHWRARRVGVEAVRELYGVLAARRMAGGFVVTSGDFTDEARAFANGRELQLVNGLALKRGLQAQAAQQPAARRVPAATTASAGTARHAAGAPDRASSLVPACPLCRADMVLRQARSGAHAGESFWGCSQYGVSKCRGTREVI